MAQSSNKTSARTNGGKGTIRAALLAAAGLGLWAWAFAAFAHGPALTQAVQSYFELDGGLAFGLAYGLKFSALLAGVALMERAATFWWRE